MSRAFNLGMLVVLSVALVLVAWFAPRAAERLGKWEITLLYNGKDYDSVSRTFRTLGEPYDSKVACDIAITRVKVMVTGARLRCDPVEQWRVN